MHTAAFQVEINETGIPNQDNVKVNVRGIGTCKISTTPEDLVNAAETFLGKTPEDIKRIIENILKGHLRSIVGKLNISQLLRERDVFNQKVFTESSDELKRLGVQIITLVIQDIDDELGYIEALGKRAVAEAKRDADIKVAEAEKEAAVKVSDAAREAATVKAQNEAKVAEAIFRSVAAPFGSIDKVTVLDMGGDGQGLQKFGSFVPDTVFKFIAALTARGIDVKAIAEKFGVNIDSLLEMLGQSGTSTAEKKS